MASLDDDVIGKKCSERFFAYDDTPCKVTAWVQSCVEGVVLNVGVYDYSVGKESVGRIRVLGETFLLWHLRTVFFQGMSDKCRRIIEADLWPEEGAGVVKKMIESVLASAFRNVSDFAPSEGGRFSGVDLDKHAVD
jgi:hypothetical protein